MSQSLKTWNMKATQIDCQQVLFVTLVRGELLKEKKSEILIIDFEADMINKDFSSSAIKSQASIFASTFFFLNDIPIRYLAVLGVASLNQLTNKLLED